MKVMKSTVLAAALFFSLIADGSAQTSGDLELQLKPEQIKDGLPQAFLFSFINQSRHNVRLPTPTIDCGDSYDGFIMLRVNFVPLKPGEGGVGRGCAADKANWPTFVKRVKEWKVLRPGESLSIEATVSRPGDSFGSEKVYRSKVFVDDHAAGSYEFWADYTPPVISPKEERALIAAGIRFPRGGMKSGHLNFRKDQ